MIIKDIKKRLYKKYFDDSYITYFMDIYYKIKSQIMNPIRGIINIIKWSPIIFKDRQWDHFYFLEIIKYKLTLMEKFFREEGHHVLAERDSHKMKICRILCSRLLDDNYYDNVFEGHNKKWGKSKMIFNSDNTLNFNRPNCITEEDHKKERVEYQKLIKKEEYLINQDLDLLFTIIRKNIMRWWD